ncbi:MAG: prepilin-type N-terminal cleavage/methylation domain-containing protein [Verrucomicrobiota bacterium JB024]|nr:prepilin-type N-terminal cleavage/methylation domain-containing protein [Verrucomicrobiota bacterium JB024]
MLSILSISQKMKFSRLKTTASNGFSLTELLVALAIIAVLAAIIIPAVGNVSRTANSTKCLSNLHQIGTAITLYSQENNGYFPYGIKQKGVIRWSHEIQNYLASTTGKKTPTEVFVCPSESTELLEQSGNGDYYRNTNYIANPALLTDDRDPQGTGSSVSRISYFNVLRPAEVILVADGTVNNNGGSEWGFFSQTGITRSSETYADEIVRDETEADAGSGRRLSWRHDGHVQAVFVDGHVDGFSVGELKYKNFHYNY